MGAALFAALSEKGLALTCASAASPSPPTSLRVQHGQRYHRSMSTDILDANLSQWSSHGKKQKAKSDLGVSTMCLRGPIAREYTIALLL